MLHGWLNQAVRSVGATGRRECKKKITVAMNTDLLNESVGSTSRHRPYLDLAVQRYRERSI